MKTVHVSIHPVHDEDFKGGPIICQNRACMSLIEPPVDVAKLTFPDGRVLETILCNKCMPLPELGKQPQMMFHVLDANPILRKDG